MKLNDLQESSNVVYQSVYHATGDDAQYYLDMIDNEGAHEALRDMLINLPYEDEPELPSKPWHLFSHKEKIGDYVLYWDKHHQSVGIVELGRENGQDY